jgi:hypothetical protein
MPAFYRDPSFEFMDSTALRNVAIGAGVEPAVAACDLTTTPALQTVDHFGRNSKNTPPLHFTSTTFEHICSALPSGR